MITTAIVVEEPGGDFVLGEVELDEPRADEVLVRMVATGLCHSDVSMSRLLPGEMFPQVFGHEGAGVVEQVGSDVVDLAVGDHVVLSFRSCRTCASCQEGLSGYCDQTVLLNFLGSRPDGSPTIRREGQPVFGSFFGQSSLAAHALAYADNCVKVDPAVDLTRAAPLGCGFQTGAGTVLNVMRARDRDMSSSSLVVFGAGSVGLSALAAAAACGVGTLVAVDPKPARRELAQSYGATAIDPGADQAVLLQALQAATGGGPHWAIDTTAVPAVVATAQHALRPRGTLVALGFGTEPYTIDSVDLLYTGKHITSSVEGDSDPQVTVPELLAMQRDGSLSLSDLVTTYPAADVATALADSAAGRVVKPVLVW